VQGLVGGAQQRETVGAPVLQPGAELRILRLGPAVRDAGEEPARRPQREQAEQVLHLLLGGQRQAEDGLVQAFGGALNGGCARRRVGGQHAGQDRRHDRVQGGARLAVEHESLGRRRMGITVDAAAGGKHQRGQGAGLEEGSAACLHIEPLSCFFA
jgi:hypothetical protein